MNLKAFLLIVLSYMIVQAFAFYLPFWFGCKGKSGVWKGERGFLLAKSKADDIKQYKKMTQLIKLKQQGASYEAIKEYAVNGTITNDQNNSTSHETYQDISLQGNFEQKCNAIIDFKRRNQRKFTDKSSSELLESENVED